MESNFKKNISACIIVYNEEKIIRRCLDSIKDLVDEIILVHDGECSDKTLEIAKEYTDKVFVRDHIGEAEPHRVFCLEQARGEWILQIDADEYLNIDSHEKIKEMINNDDVNGYKFHWEFWNGLKVILIPGLYKLCLYRKNNFSYFGVPHESGEVSGKVFRSELLLCHRPNYNNISMRTHINKDRKWEKIRAKYFFSEIIKVQSFNADVKQWYLLADKKKRYIWLYLFIEPLKIFLVQGLKNKLWLSYYGFIFSIQQALNEFLLCFNIIKYKRFLNNKKSL
ncbi:MAG: glycosyltransferase family 2 protein [bacterium]